MRTAIRIGLAAAAVTAAAVLLASALGDEGDSRQAKVSDLHSPSSRDVAIPVEVFEYGFNPSNAVIEIGQAVAFKGVGKELHDVVPASAEGERFFVAAERRGASRPVFTEPGVFPLTCAIHPRMRGRVTVVRDLDRYLEHEPT